MTTITTAAAATEAHVTVATIRTWCRRGVVAATKQAGRWVIDAASLARRIAIGAMRARKAQPMTSDTLTAEWHREMEGHIIQLRKPSTDPTRLGSIVARIQIHLHDGQPTVCDCRSSRIESGLVHQFDAGYAETVLRSHGWAVAGPWKRRRSMMTAPVTAL